MTKKEKRKPLFTVATLGTEADLIRAAAKIVDDFPTVFVRDAALREAKRILARDRKAKAKGGEG